MEIFQGKSIYQAIAIGPILSYEKQSHEVILQNISDVLDELRRYEKVKAKAKEELVGLYNQALEEVGQTNAEIFSSHCTLLDDEDFNKSIYQLIKTENANVEYAIWQTCNKFTTLFSSLNDEYMNARCSDLRDITERLLSILYQDFNSFTLTDPVILIADDLTPSELINLDKSKLLALVLNHCSINSHTAILARTMSIPTITGIDLKNVSIGDTAIVNGHTGQIIIDPGNDLLTQFSQQLENEQNNTKLLLSLKGKKTVTLDGQTINLYANIGHLNDLDEAISQDAEGVGLLRSEFIYMEKTDFPSEEEQFLIYKSIAEKMSGKRVVIRTLDIGADKQADYFKLEKEENPAMGLRGIRVCLNRQDIFKTQLKAILRASVYGNIAIMLPMIISENEIIKAKEIYDAAKRELNELSLPFKNIPFGIMIETPAAAMISDILAKQVDFFSIGTNDLSQYTLAIDRQNHLLDSFFDTHHEAILRMIELTVKNAHENNIPVGICGELASDPRLTEKFVRMKIDELSVSPSCILGLRKQIRDMNFSAK